MIDFLITLFFGMFGAHKFKQGDKRMGFVYLFTLGLFGIGWIYDFSVAFINIFKPTNEKRFKKEYRLPFYKYLVKYIFSDAYRDTMLNYGITNTIDFITLKKFYDWYELNFMVNPLYESYSFTVYSQALNLKGSDKVGEFDRITNILIKLGAVERNSNPPYELENYFGILFSRIIPRADGRIIHELREKPTLYEDYKNLDNGLDFERFMAYVLKKNDYSNVVVSQGSGDQGVDITAEKNNTKYAIQCKLYSNNVGNDAVQQITAGKNHYNAHVGIVATNSDFTKSAKELANSNNILLWNGAKIENMIHAIS